MQEKWNNIVCPGCACLCDDVCLTTQEGRVIEFEPSCELGDRWFKEHSAPAEFVAKICGIEAPFEDAIDKAAELLNKSDYPLIYGLSRSSTPGQRIAVELGEKLGSVVDTTASLCHGPSIMAIQEIGEVTCTLGEVRNRADLVIFWGCNPAKSHPRHAERYSVHPKGKYLAGGRPDRKIVMIGSEAQLDSWALDTAGTEPDLRIPIPEGKDYEVIGKLKRLFESENPLSAHPHANDIPMLAELVQLVRECKYGIVFFGLGLAETGSWGDTEKTGTGQVNVQALLHLVAEFNSVSRFTARRMRLQGDVSGADNVLLWQSSYPFAVDFSRGYPRYNPGEFTTNELLERKEADLALFVGAETTQYFTDDALAHLETIPKIVLDYPGTQNQLSADVEFTTGVYGIHAEGTAYRMDNVPLQLSQLIASDLPTDEHVLAEIMTRVANRNEPVGN